MLVLSKIHLYVAYFHIRICINHAGLQKLVVIGGTVETARRASMSAWNGFVDCRSLAIICIIDSA